MKSTIGKYVITGVVSCRLVQHCKASDIEQLLHSLQRAVAMIHNSCCDKPPVEHVLGHV